MTVTVQLLNEEALALLLDLEKLKLLKLIAPKTKATVAKSKKNGSEKTVPSEPEPAAPMFIDERLKPGFGGAAGLITLAPDWDEPLPEMLEYMS